MIDEKYISVQKHPSMDLLIYNYTQKCQFDRVWNDETLQCRGLITDLEGNVKARPFKKFFNYGEATDIPAEKFEVFDKLDGSLGIMYFDENEFPHIATRGSFTSEQAIKATEMLHSKYPLDIYDKNLTYLFEIIYPENRIVVDYGDTEDIILLTIRDTETGIELSHNDMVKLYGDFFKTVHRFDFDQPLEKIKEVVRDNAEGFVIRFEGGDRLKLKYEEYVRLHRLVTGVNAKTIWELLRANQPFEELMERVPDEFFAWVNKTKTELIEEYELLEKMAQKHFEIIATLPTRKDQALSIQKHAPEVSGVIFKMLDGQPYQDIIWKMIRPRADKPWKEDIDA